MEVLICFGISAKINDDIYSVQYNHVIRYEKATVKCSLWLNNQTTDILKTVFEYKIWVSVEKPFFSPFSKREIGIKTF